MKVLKFGAIWCNACLIMKPRWAELEKEYDWLETEYYDADERQDLIDQYDISNIPCFIFLDKDGQEIKRLSGEISKEELVKTITQLKDK
jgi:thiol-disulfide isomerase/thioredoxin